MSEGKWIRFKQEKIGLFVYNVRKRLVDFSVKTNSFSYELYFLFQTVTEMKSHFSTEEINLAEKAKDLCRRICGSPLRKFYKWLNKGFLTHVDITLKDARKG